MMEKKEKDPAVLFYVKDFMTGSSLLTPLQKGHYITLLCHQQQSNSGSLSLPVIEKIMGKDFKKQWPVLLEKFKEDDAGFYNERMRKEIARRKKNSEAQRDKALARWEKEQGNGMPGHSHGMAPVLPIIATETAIATEELEYGGLGERNLYPGQESMEMELPEMKAGAVIQLLTITKNVFLDDKKVNGLWHVFKAQHFNGKKWYADKDDIFTHFINWTRKQEINNGKINLRNSGQKPVPTIKPTGSFGQL